ncbi:MAG TPA: hypothetical protein VNJ04_03730, partial [Gemmatimonadaceae bacterium]|nr:hypothetical protein [Gemmatimonadaceae bacterium]
WLGLAGGSIVGAGVALTFLPRAVTEVPAVRYLTYSGHDSSPAVSADGRLIAFSSDRDGRSRIWLKQVTGGAEAALTSGEDDYPRFSPDGSQLLFVRTSGNTKALYRVATLGGEPRKLLDDAVDADWSPDGRQLAFVRWHVSKDVARSTVWVIQADGGVARQIAEVDQSQLVHPRWSPDGRTIAAVTRVQQAGLPHRILLIDADGRSSRVLSPVSGIGGPSAIAWSGDGREIVYLQAASVGGHATGSAARLIRQNVETSRATTMMWSPNSGLVFDILAPGRAVFDGRSPRENLQEITTGKGIGEPAARWLTRGNSSDRQPIYSPDGEWVVFTSNRSGNLDLWSISTRTGTVRPVTDDAAEDWDPSFAMGGKKLLWSSNRGGNFEVWMAEPDGRGARQVSHDGIDAENPTATPDGSWILYNSGNPAHPGIWKMRADGSAATRLVAGSTLVPEVSPDGTYVLYLTAWRTQRPTIRVAEVSSGKPVEFTIEVDTTKTFLDVGRARWMPDGRSIAFLGEDARGLLGIFAQDFRPGENTARSRRPVGGFSADAVAESFGVAGDGRRLTIASWEQLSSIMSAEGLPGITPPRRGPQ